MSTRQTIVVLFGADVAKSVKYIFLYSAFFRKITADHTPRQILVHDG